MPITLRDSVAAVRRAVALLLLLPGRGARDDDDPLQPADGAGEHAPRLRHPQPESLPHARRLRRARGLQLDFQGRTVFFDRTFDVGQDDAAGERVRASRSAARCARRRQRPARRRPSTSPRRPAIIAVASSGKIDVSGNPAGNVLLAAGRGPGRFADERHHPGDRQVDDQSPNPASGGSIDGAARRARSRRTRRSTADGGSAAQGGEVAFTAARRRHSARRTSTSAAARSTAARSRSAPATT